MSQPFHSWNGNRSLFVLSIITGILLVSARLAPAALYQSPPSPQTTSNPHARPELAQLSARQVVERVQQRYRAMKTFQADFTQIYRAHLVQDEEKGVVMIKKPRKMYWEYHDPVEKYLFASGGEAFFYVPRDRQVTVYELTDDRFFMFFMGEGRITEEFEVAFESEEAPLKRQNFLLRLTPRVEDPSISRILLEIAPASYLIERFVTIEPIGSRNDYILNNIQEDVTIPDRIFRFKPPKDVEIVREIGE